MDTLAIVGVRFSFEKINFKYDLLRVQYVYTWKQIQERLGGNESFSFSRKILRKYTFANVRIC